MINLNDRQSGLGNDSASLRKRCRNSEMLEKEQQETKLEGRDYRKSLSVDKLILPAYLRALSLAITSL